MSRYEPFDPQELREPPVGSETARERKPEDNSPSVGRGGSSGGEQTDSRDRTDGERNKESLPRQQHRDRDRTYNLRESEIRTLAEIGSFRALRTKDLVEFQYRGNEKQADQDLRNLKTQGLIQQKTLPGTEKEPLLTLSREAREFLDRNRPQDVPRDQALYHGFVKPREAFDLLQLLNTGHSGTLSTVHASSAQQAISRFTSCVLQSGVELPYRAIKTNIGDSLNVIIQLERRPGRRFVSEVLEIGGYSADADHYKLTRAFAASE